MDRALASASRGPGSSYTALLAQCLSLPRCVNGYRQIHLFQGGVEILLVASCHRNRDKRRPAGPHGSYADFTSLPSSLPTKEHDTYAKEHDRSAIKAQLRTDDVSLNSIEETRTIQFRTLLYTLY